MNTEDSIEKYRSLRHEMCCSILLFVVIISSWHVNYNRKHDMIKKYSWFSFQLSDKSKVYAYMVGFKE